MGEENDQVGLTISPIRGLGPGPATAGHMQRLMGSPGRGAKAESSEPRRSLGERGVPGTWKGPVILN